MKKIAIVQSNYIPWKGYFDLVCAVDLFIFHDDLQFTKNDWRNRNKIKTPRGLEWLTIPCGTNEHRRICDVELIDMTWQMKHWHKLKLNYKNAPYFKTYEKFFEAIYVKKEWKNLSDLNQHLITTVSRELLGNTHVIFEDSRVLKLKHRKMARVIEILEKVGATEYISGPAAKDYIDEQVFTERNIKLTWFDYSGYPEYPQLWEGFAHDVTILDLLFNCGKDAPRYMKCARL